MTGNSQFYQETQPRPAAQATTDTSTESASSGGSAQPASAPLPPLRNQTQTPDAQEATNGSQPDAASQSAQQTQAPAQNGNAFSGAATFLKQGFSALTTPPNQ
jgi:hypothetical protein